jgi:hypothetical protein
MVEEIIQLLKHVVFVEEDLFKEDNPNWLVLLDLFIDVYMRLESSFGTN